MVIKYLDAKRIRGSQANANYAPNTLGSSADGVNINDPTSVASGDTNGVATPSGLGLKSLYFDGNDSINIDGVAQFTTTTGGSAGTVSVWWYNTGSGEYKIISMGDTNASTFLSIQTRDGGSDDKFVFQCEDGGTNEWEVRNTGNLSIGWHHGVISQNGTAVVPYVDGVALTSFDVDRDKSKFVFSGIDNGRIGCKNWGNGANEDFFTGNLMEVAFWNVALTEAQVQNLYGNGGSTAKTADTYTTGLRAYYSGDNIPATNEAILIDEKSTLVDPNFLSSRASGSKQLDESANKYGVLVALNNLVVGKELKSITFSMKKNASPTGNIYGKIYKGDSTSATETSTNYFDVSAFDGTDFADKTFEFPTGVTIESGDRIVFEGGSHDGTNQIAFEYNITSFTDSGSIARYTSSWVDGINGDAIHKITTTRGLPENTIFEETDTYSTYWLQSSGWNVDASGAVNGKNIAGNNVGWTSDDATNTKATGTLISQKVDSSGDVITFDMGSGAVSDTAWVLRWVFDAKDTPADATYWNIGMSDNTAKINASQDFVGCQWRYANSSNRWFGTHDSDGAAPNGIAKDNKFDESPSVNTKLYFEVKRTSSTAMTLNRYSDSTYSSVSETCAGTPAAGAVSLRYLKLVSWTDSNQNVTIELSDIKFKNGVTSW